MNLSFRNYSFSWVCNVWWVSLLVLQCCSICLFVCLFVCVLTTVRLLLPSGSPWLRVFWRATSVFSFQKTLYSVSQSMRNDAVFLLLLLLLLLLLTSGSLFTTPVLFVCFNFSRKRQTVEIRTIFHGTSIKMFLVQSDWLLIVSPGIFHVSIRCPLIPR